MGDDFDWLLRDYDGFRMFMLEELAARFPERRRWTPADMEVVLVEVLATVLDQLSDMADRVAAEAYLETARQVGSVYKLLKLIGYDAAEQAGYQDPDPGDPGPSAEAQLMSDWNEHPEHMEAARVAGPLAIHNQRRMVTVKDYANRLEDHPLVERAYAEEDWDGSWTIVKVTLTCWDGMQLDDPCPEKLAVRVADFHKTHGLYFPDIDSWSSPSFRTILRTYLDRYRMIGQEVWLQDANYVGIVMSISITLKQDYFQSEVRRVTEQALGRGPGGFFEPGRLRFGEDVYASDIHQTLMQLDGVENVCLNRFKRFGPQYADQAASGLISMRGKEIATCDNKSGEPQRGYFDLKLIGGRKG